MLTSRKLFFTTEVEDEDNDHGEDDESLLENVRSLNLSCVY